MTQRETQLETTNSHEQLTEQPRVMPSTLASTKQHMQQAKTIEQQIASNTNPSGKITKRVAPNNLHVGGGLASSAGAEPESALSSTD